jgi:hypothetical protein
LDILDRGILQHFISCDCLHVGCIALFIDGEVHGHGSFDPSLTTERWISALSGPPELRQSAINAVSLWRYKPFQAGGHLVKVDTTATVHF